MESQIATSLELPQSDLAERARQLVAEVTPPFVYHHSLRSFLFGRSIAAAKGLRAGVDYDDDLVYLSCVLHDLGATDYANGDQRFEVDGADAATAFLQGLDITADQIRIVWNAIALHTSVGLAHRFGPVEAVTQMGIAADIIGQDRQLLAPGFAERVHAQWPRHDLGYALAAALADQVEQNPAKGMPLTFPGHVHQLLYPASVSPTWFDLVETAGWGDRPVVDGAAKPDR